jgi:hypothetical protein
MSQARRGQNNSDLEAYKVSLAIRRRLAQIDPNNIQWRRDEAYILNRIGDEYHSGGMSHEAIAAYEGSIAIRCHLTKIDPRNRQRQLDVSMSLKSSVTLARPR